MSEYSRVMVTGHRPQHMDGQQTVFAKQELKRLVVKLRDEHGMTAGISGMALGADTWWADAVLEAEVDLWAYIPFEAQPYRWSNHDQSHWRELRSRASREVVVGGRNYDVKMLHARNDAMVRDSDLAIAVWEPSKITGGTASAVKKLRSLGREIVIVDLEKFQTYLSVPR